MRHLSQGNGATGPGGKPKPPLGEQRAVLHQREMLREVLYAEGLVQMKRRPHSQSSYRDSDPTSGTLQDEKERRDRRLSGSARRLA